MGKVEVSQMKAFDSVDHEVLWSTLRDMGLGEQLIKILKSLYKDSSVQILVNGHSTRKVFCRKGIKQGCILSLLLFILLLADLGAKIEKHESGIKLMGRHFSGMLWVDDLILAAKEWDNINNLQDEVNKLLLQLGMAINCTKSNTMSLKEKIAIGDMEVLGANDELVGVITNTEKYKYLGVNLGIGNTAQIYDFTRKNIKSKLKSFAGYILRMAKQSYSPVTVGVALWQAYALPSILYGIETASITRAIINDLESTQGSFVTSLLGVRCTASHEAALREVGLPRIEQIICIRKLHYLLRVIKLPNDSLAKAALEECRMKGYGKNASDMVIPEVRLKGEWTSSFMGEIEKILLMLGVLDMEYISKKFCLRKGKKMITDATVSYFADRSHGIMDKQR